MCTFPPLFTSSFIHIVTCKQFRIDNERYWNVPGDLPSVRVRPPARLPVIRHVSLLTTQILSQYGFIYVLSVFNTPPVHDVRDDIQRTIK